MEGKKPVVSGLDLFPKGWLACPANTYQAQPIRG